MTNLTDKQLHRRFKKIGFEKMSLTRKLYALLPEIRNREIFKKKGCVSIQEYALKFGGLSYSATQNCLAVAKKVENFPLIASEIKNVGLYKAALATKIATPENEKIIVDKMKNLSRNALKDFVNEVEQKGSGKRKCQAVVAKKSINLDSEAQKAFNLLKVKLGVHIDENELIKEIFKIAEKFLEQQTTAKSQKSKQNLLPAVNSQVSRYIPKKIKNDLLQKSKGICQYPGCIRCAAETHHIDRFSENHNHENILALCKEHHEFAHNGIFKENTDDFCFEVGVSKMADLDYRLRKELLTAPL